jgi:hypothetical protein
MNTDIVVSLHLVMKLIDTRRTQSELILAGPVLTTFNTFNNGVRLIKTRSGKKDRYRPVAVRNGDDDDNSGFVATYGAK